MYLVFSKKSQNLADPKNKKKKFEKNWTKKVYKTGSRGGWAHFARKKGLDEHTFTFDSHESCSWCFKKRSKSGSF